MERFIRHIIPQPVAQAICRTLLHSLWQGLLLALFTGLIMLLTRPARAALRYSLLVGTLLLYSLSMALTFALELNSGTVDGNFTAGSGLFPALNGRFDAVLKSAHEHAGTICGVWLLVVTLLQLRLWIGLLMVERLKRYKVKLIKPFWQEKTKQLCHDLGIRRAVVLLESAIAKVPMVIGFLKPAILVPIGLINAMEPAQVEAILLHELAHIQRSDYLVNFLQTLLETLFFFNPAVWWLSSLIRAEREHCCDDLALAHMTNQMAYLKALVHFEEYRLSTPRQAVAFGGSRGVLTRMERIARGKNRALGKLELAILGFVLLLCTLFIAAAPRNPVSSLLKTPSARSKSPVDRQLEAKRKTEAEAAARSRTNHSP